MTIARRMAFGYACISLVCLLLLVWLGYHEFVEEPAEFAARGYTNIHEDTEAELSTVSFLAAVPILLAAGWWWMRRVLAPLTTLTSSLETVDPRRTPDPLPRSHKGDEVDKLAAAFNSMAGRLDASFRRIQEFTLHASHELKTPLTVMRAHLETARRESKESDIQDGGWIADQLEEVKRLTQIVDSLTLLTKADAGQVQLERQPVALHELVEEAFEDAQVLAQPYGLSVSLDESAAAIVTGDRHRLRQLLLILTDNAVKYNHPGGRVDISLRQSDHAAEIRVSNTSAALKPESLARVFDRFARGENAQGKVDGCGLGLTIAKWIVETHGGGIRLAAGKDDSVSAVVTLPV